MFLIRSATTNTNGFMGMGSSVAVPPLISGSRVNLRQVTEPCAADSIGGGDASRSQTEQQWGFPGKRGSVLSAKRHTHIPCTKEDKILRHHNTINYLPLIIILCFRPTCLPRHVSHINILSLARMWVMPTRWPTKKLNMQARPRRIA